MQKRCRECRSSAYDRQERRDRYARDREKELARAKRWNQENPEKHKATMRRANLKKAYGITVEQYDAMLASQNGECAICYGGPNGKGNRLHVDHCHESGQIRGLLCGECNFGLGKFGDDIARLRSAADYLESF